MVSTSCCPRGTLVGIVGANGVSKSTLLKVLSGGLRADRGTIRHRGGSANCTAHGRW
ncbi:ATP-binding cassette domain-containing protein [Nocardia sp. NPDC004278]